MGDSRDDAVYGTEISETIETTASATDVEILSEPKYVSLDDLTTQVILPDDSQETIVTGIGWSSSGSGNFFLHNGDGTLTPKGQHFYFSSNSGDFIPCRIKFAGGDPVKAKVVLSVGSGNVKIYVEYHRKAFQNRIPANNAAYAQA